MNKRVFCLLLLVTLSASLFTSHAQSGIFDPFHTKDEKIALWQTLWETHPGANYISLGNTYEGKSIWLFAAGNPNGGRILWDSELHGTEDKGGEILYLIAKWLLESGDPRATRILEENYVMFVPVINWRTERVSAAGVDLNRNFVTGWSRWGDGDTYPGAFAASEPETQILRHLFLQSRPAFYVNLHVGAGPYAAYYNGGNATLSQQVVDRQKQICNETGVTPYPTRVFGSNGYAIGDAVALGAQSAWIIETVGEATAWRHLPEHYDELRDIYYPKCLAIFIAMCELSEPTPIVIPEFTSLPIFLTLIIFTGILLAMKMKRRKGTSTFDALFNQS